MRAAVPSSIQLLMMSAPIGEVLTIVAQSAEMIGSSSGAGGTTQPTRGPGEGVFDRVGMNTVRFGRIGWPGSRACAGKPMGEFWERANRVSGEITGAHCVGSREP